MTLREEIANGETATLEFKEARPKDSIKFTKTVVAFANGRVLARCKRCLGNSGEDYPKDYP